jgi:hypothetical protein
MEVSDTTGFPTWKVITLGTMSASELRQTLKDEGFSVSGFAEDILTRIAVASPTSTIEAIAVSTDDLELERKATREQIYARAMERGFDLVPAEVGPQLRLQYPDQPDGERLFVGMEPMTACDGNHYVFLVKREGSSRWLFGYPWDPDGSEARWVFIRRK